MKTKTTIIIIVGMTIIPTVWMLTGPSSKGGMNDASHSSTGVASTTEKTPLIAAASSESQTLPKKNAISKESCLAALKALELNEGDKSFDHILETMTKSQIGMVGSAVTTERRQGRLSDETVAKFNRRCGQLDGVEILRKIFSQDLDDTPPFAQIVTGKIMEGLASVNPDSAWALLNQYGKGSGISLNARADMFEGFFVNISEQNPTRALGYFKEITPFDYDHFFNPKWGETLAQRLGFVDSFSMLRSLSGQVPGDLLQSTAAQSLQYKATFGSEATESALSKYIENIPLANLSSGAGTILGKTALHADPSFNYLIKLYDAANAAGSEGVILKSSILNVDLAHLDVLAAALNRERTKPWFPQAAELFSERIKDVDPDSSKAWAKASNVR